MRQDGASGRWSESRSLGCGFRLLSVGDATNKSVCGQGPDRDDLRDASLAGHVMTAQQQSHAKQDAYLYTHMRTLLAKAFVSRPHGRDAYAFSLVQTGWQRASATRLAVEGHQGNLGAAQVRYWNSRFTSKAVCLSVPMLWSQVQQGPAQTKSFNGSVTRALYVSSYRLLAVPAGLRRYPKAPEPPRSAPPVLQPADAQ